MTEKIGDQIRILPDGFPLGLVLGVPKPQVDIDPVSHATPKVQDELKEIFRRAESAAVAIYDWSNEEDPDAIAFRNLQNARELECQLREIGRHHSYRELSSRITDSGVILEIKGLEEQF